MRGVMIVLICVMLITVVCEIASAGGRGRRYREDAGRTCSVMEKDVR